MDLDKPSNRWNEVMQGLKPEKRITGTILKISDDGTVKLFGLTIKKGKKNEKDDDNDGAGSTADPGDFCPDIR